MREPWTMAAPEGLAGGIPRARPSKAVPRRRDRLGDGLARQILARLPVAVAVLDADANLSFWNEQASLLFGAAPLLAAERPSLSDMLARAENLTQPQRERIAAFVTAHIKAGDRTDPDGWLQLTVGRGWRIAIQVHGLGHGRWMLLFDDGKATGNQVAQDGSDAWLDSLTGLSNRRQFNERLQEALDHATPDTSQAVLLIDLDQLGGINETLGHPVGDALLCLVAQRLRREMREVDLLARLGGDGFAVLIANGDCAETLAARAVDVLARPFLVDGQRVTISASVGMVRFPDHGTSTDDLMRHAELALGQAKSAGGRSWCLFDPAMVSEVSLRQELEADLRKALLKGELSLAYQPCGDSSSRAISGFEARPRWDHPVRGLVPASVLMKLAEAGGLIVALGEWALKTACIEAAGWPVSLSSAPLNVVVRVSAHELRSPGHLPGVVQQGLAASGLQPDRLELKIPDTCLQDTTLEVLPILHRLKALGVRIVLAECTIGPSLLSRLKSFPFSAVAFGAGAGTDANGGRLHEALAAVGVDHIGCYLDSSLTSTAGIAEVLQLHASTCNPAAVVG